GRYKISLSACCCTSYTWTAYFTSKPSFKSQPPSEYFNGTCSFQNQIDYFLFHGTPRLTLLRKTIKFGVIHGLAAKLSPQKALTPNQLGYLFESTVHK